VVSRVQEVLEPELARAKRRAELETKIERAASELARTSPAKQANSDAKALSSYLQALGFDADADRVNKLLVLLAVLMIEAGGGLSLALGLALSGPPEARGEARNDKCAEPEHSRTPQPNTASAQGLTLAERPNTLDRTPDRSPPITVRPPPGGVIEWLTRQGGKANTSRRRLATALGRSPSAVHDELHRLAACGAITMIAGPRGTLLALRPN